jgi:hypothetical protein
MNIKFLSFGSPFLSKKERSLQRCCLVIVGLSGNSTADEWK